MIKARDHKGQFTLKHQTYVGEHRYLASCGHLAGNASSKLCGSCYKVRGNTDGRLYTTPEGYKMFRIRGRYKGLHRVIVEKVLGRGLERNEVVHHINADPSDNRNCNLLVCTTAYHSQLHAEMSRRYAARFDGG